MTLDPLASQLRFGRPSARVTTRRQHHGSRASSELNVRYTRGQLRRAFRSVQSPVAATIGAVVFGLGLAMLLIGVATFSLNAWALVACGLLLSAMGGWVLAVPILQAHHVEQQHGVDGIVAMRLLANQHGLVVMGRNEPSVTAWSAIDRVQIHDRHVGLVAGRRFVIPPLRLDDDQGPFAARVLAQANGTDSVATVRPICRMRWHWLSVKG